MQFLMVGVLSTVFWGSGLVNKMRDWDLWPDHVRLQQPRFQLPKRDGVLLIQIGFSPFFLPLLNSARFSLFQQHFVSMTQ